MKALTMEGIINTPPDLFERIGIIGVDKIKALKDYQSWYKKTMPLSRDRLTKLFNYYHGLEDERSLAEVRMSRS